MLEVAQQLSLEEGGLLLARLQLAENYLLRDEILLLCGGGRVLVLDEEGGAVVAAANAAELLKLLGVGVEVVIAGATVFESIRTTLHILIKSEIFSS